MAPSPHTFDPLISCKAAQKASAHLVNNFPAHKLIEISVFENHKNLINQKRFPVLFPTAAKPNKNRR